ncbi:hypothetical protein BGZ83_010140 [Gryganskiella cystojenkinii]|nr:hypothetical protein BGZ83_010140 [Gryganskiella cystojenkinii]
MGRLAYLLKDGKGRRYRFGRTDWIYWPSQICMGAIAIFAYLSAYMLSQDGPANHLALVGNLAMALTWTLAMVVNYYEHLYTIRSSDVVFSCYLVFITSVSIHVRTAYLVFTMIGNLPSMPVPPPPSQPTFPPLSWDQDEIDKFIPSSLLRVILSSPLPFLVLGLLIEAWPRGKTLVQRRATTEEGASDWDKANFFSRITFHFQQPILTLSMKKQGDLKPDDIQNQLPSYLKLVNSRLQPFWDHALAKSSWSSSKGQKQSATRGNSGQKGGNDDKIVRPSLLWVFLRAEGFRLVPLILTRIARPAATFAVPFVLSLFLRYLQDVQRVTKDGEGGGNQTAPSLEYGLFLATAMFLTTLTSAILLVVNRDQVTLLSLHSKTQLISLIYQKSLRLSPGARQQLQFNGKPSVAKDEDKEGDKDKNKNSNNGSSSTRVASITNLMEVDAELWAGGFIDLSMWISFPIEIGLSLYLLYDLLGWSVWVGLAVIVSLTPIQIYRAKFLTKMQRLKLGHMDDRIRVTTEVLSAIKVVKLYCWILGHRNKELNELRRMGIMYSFMSILYISSNLVICLVTLSVFVIYGGELTPQTVFVSMALFSMLRIPIANISEAIGATLDLTVASRRIEDFLLLEEIDTNVVERVPENSQHREPGEVVVAMTNATFSWIDRPETNAEENINDESQALLSAIEETFAFKPTLQNINLLVARESLVAIVGRVGEGKSSLLSAVIGEMYKLQGHVRTKGKIAYVPQQPWILNMTVRENILFGKPMDQDRYRAVLFACGLEPDLDLMPAGDMTEIGERGINLSGGQKQRVSLARAAYQDADIYLLDDPLSAVDAHVDQHLWSELIGPNGLLRNKTRLLVTHGIHHLKAMDQIMVIKDGAIVEAGGYDELITQEHIFSRLILEYAVEHRRDKKQTKATTDSDSTTRLSSITKTSTGVSHSSDSSAIQERATVSKMDTKAELIAKEKMQDGNVSWDVFMTYIRAVLGRILNRVSGDIAAVDQQVPAKIFEVTNNSVILIASLIIVSVTTPIFLIALPFLLLAFGIVTQIYIKASRSCKRIESVAKSPIFQHFTESLGGLSTIRAMHIQDRFQEENDTKVDLHTNAFVVFLRCIRWLEIRTQVMSSLIILLTSVWFVLAPRGSIDASTAGLALSFAMSITNAMIWFVRNYCDLQNQLVAVERIREYADMQPEAPMETKQIGGSAEAERALRHGWPTHGGIMFDHYSIRYREGLDLVLKEVSFEVRGGEKVAVVGRTGAGKSSLTLALFRMIEAADSHWVRATNNAGPVYNESSDLDFNNGHGRGGKIEIDGIDISTLGLRDLRQHLSIIPQEPTLFAGTIRENLDPFGESSDTDLWECLERAHLKDTVTGLPGGLSFQVASQGENFSVGQRSLICLARALLRKSRILILDEATAAVDVETDELIQNTIRKEFADRTVLTIAHRIKTVMDSDQILVLDQGRVLEYAPPKVLLQDKGSMFYSLAKQAGEL